MEGREDKKRKTVERKGKRCFDRNARRYYNRRGEEGEEGGKESKREGKKKKRSEKKARGEAIGFFSRRTPILIRTRSMQAGWMPASTPADTTGRYDACNLFLLPPIFFLPLDQLPLISRGGRRGAPRDRDTRRRLPVRAATDPPFSRFFARPHFHFPNSKYQ